MNGEDDVFLHKKSFAGSDASYFGQNVSLVFEEEAKGAAAVKVKKRKAVSSRKKLRKRRKRGGERWARSRPTTTRKGSPSLLNASAESKSSAISENLLRVSLALDNLSHWSTKSLKKMVLPRRFARRRTFQMSHSVTAGP